MSPRSTPAVTAAPAQNGRGACFSNFVQGPLGAPDPYSRSLVGVSNGGKAPIFASPMAKVMEDESWNDNQCDSPGKVSNAGMPSVGSVGHPFDCQPCKFYCFGSRSCRYADDCPFCHLEHTSKNQEKRSAWKEKRDRKKLSRKASKDVNERVALESTQVQRPYADKLAGSVTPTGGAFGYLPPFGGGPAPQMGSRMLDALSGRANVTPSPAQGAKDRAKEPAGQAFRAWDKRSNPWPLSAENGNGARTSHRDAAPPARAKRQVNEPTLAAPGLAAPALEAQSADPLQVDSMNFSESVAVLSIKGNPVSISIGNPYLYDCPIIGISDGFRNLTGYSREDVVGRNCRLMNSGCVLDELTRLKMRHSSKTGCEITVVVENMRKNGEYFHNLVYMVGFMLGGRTYMVGIQADDMIASGDKISTWPDHQRELQSMIDRIFDMHVDKWAEKQLQNFCTNLPHPYCRLLHSFSPEWYEATKKKYVYQGLPQADGPVLCKNTFLHVDDDFQVNSSFGQKSRRSSSMPSRRERAGSEHFDQQFAGLQAEAEPSGEHSRFSYVPPALLLAVGQAADWRHSLSADLVDCTFSVDPPLVPGLYIDHRSGVIGGAAVEAGRCPDWMEHTVAAESGGFRWCTTIHVKVVDLCNEVRLGEVGEDSPQLWEAAEQFPPPGEALSFENRHVRGIAETWQSRLDGASSSGYSNRRSF